MKKSRAETLEVTLQQETSPTEGLSCRKVEAVNTENRSLKEQVHQVKSERTKLEEVVRHEDEQIKTETNKRQASTKSYLAFEKLSETEKELQSVERMWRREEEQQLGTVKNKDKLLNQKTNQCTNKRGIRRWQFVLKHLNLFTSAILTSPTPPLRHPFPPPHHVPPLDTCKYHKYCNDEIL